MPFIGFLGGVVFAALILVVYGSRAIIGQRLWSLEPHRLPPLVYALGLAYAVLFLVMWFAFFDAAWERVDSEDPNAGYVRIGRVLLARMETWDFIVTLLAFIAGVLVLTAARNVATSGDGAGVLMPPRSSGGQTTASAGFFAELMSQLRRVTALNMMLAFVLILITLPAVLPWVERRLDSVKVGSVEARLAPLAENTRRSGLPDTPTLSTTRDLSNYIHLLRGIDRIKTVVDHAPDIVAGDAATRLAVRTRYDEAGRFFNVLIIPRVARLKCMAQFAGVRVSDVPGAREAALAFLVTLREVKEHNTAETLPRALELLAQIDTYFYRSYYNLSAMCEKEINKTLKIFDASLTPHSAASTRRVSSGFRGLPCTATGGPAGCVDVIKNGYVTRFILEFVKISTQNQNAEFLSRMIESREVDYKTYEGFNFTEIDKFNIQLLKASYISDLPYDTAQVIASYVDVRAIAAVVIGSVTDSCGACGSSRRAKQGLEEALEAYARVMERFVDAEAVASVGGAMLRRLPLNNLQGPDAIALEGLVQAAIQSRNKILNAEALDDENSTWAAAILDEGIATIKYVQLVEDTDRSSSDIRTTCLFINERLQRAASLFALLQTRKNEHRIDRMRAERTLYLAEQFCE